MRAVVRRHSIAVASPVLKWAGGKTQLLGQIDAALPRALKQGKRYRYVEPFVGGGAVFFHLAQHYSLSQVVLADANPDLILLYSVLQHNVHPLIERLSAIESVYHQLSPEQQSDYFYEARARYNTTLPGYPVVFGKRAPTQEQVERAALLLFLNRTCYNGLYRVNRRGLFNVPFGRYNNPRICDAENLQAASSLLQGVSLLCGDFEQVTGHVDANTFVYFDPPYRPLTTSASFNAYARDPFNDETQLRLAAFYRRLDQTGARLMLSNSDPTQVDANDDFFDRAYQGFQVSSVRATRMISTNGKGRGAVRELLITNY